MRHGHGISVGPGGLGMAARVLNVGLTANEVGHESGARVGTCMAVAK